MNRNEGFIMALVGPLVVLGVCSWGAYSAYGRRAAAHEAEVNDLKLRLVGARREVAENSARAAESDKVAVAAVKAYEELRAKKPPVPVAPLPLPTTDASAASELALAGLQLTVATVPQPTITLPQSRLILTWHGQALRVPGLEGRITYDDTVIAQADKTIASLSEAANDCKSASSSKDIVIGLSDKAFKASQAEVKDLKKQASFKAFNNNLKLVIAIPVVAYLGYRVGRR